MKEPLLFLLPLLLFPFTTGKQLTETESLIQSNPDSARVLLQDWDRSTLVFPRQKALHALLYSMALDKCYIDVADDSLTSMALKYFKTSRDKNHRMKAYYYDGLVQKNSGNVIGAILHLEKALSLSKEERNLHYEGLITKNLCMLHYEEWDYYESRRYAEESFAAFNRAGEQAFELYSLFALATCHQNIAHYRESDSLFRLVLERPDAGPALRADTYLSLAGMKLSPPLYDPRASLDAMREYLSIGGTMSNDAATTLARAFVSLEQMDSAKYYLDIAKEEQLSAVDSARYYYGLYKYLAARKDLESADEYLRLCYEIEDSLTTERLKRSVMHAQKDWYKRDSEHLQDLARKRLIILVLLGSLIVFSGLVAFSYFRRKRKEFGQELERFQLVEGELKEQITQLTENDDEQKARIVSLIVGRISVITMLGRQYSALQDSPAEESGFDRFERQKRVVQRCKQEIEALRGDKTFLIGFEEAVDNSYDHVLTRLRALFGPRITEQDYQIIAMLVAGTSVKGISLVTGLEPGTISTRKTRYKERILKTRTPDAGFFIEKIYRKPLTPSFS